MPEMIRAVVVDDEPDARVLLVDRLKAEVDIEIVAVCSTGEEAVEACRLYRPSLLFLDIQMPGLSGFDVLQRLDGIARPYVIFVTAFDQYAIKAFEVAALDYLLKPFTKARFVEAVRRARKALETDGKRSNLPGTKDLIAWWETMRHRAAEKEDEPNRDMLTRLVIRENKPYRAIEIDAVDMIDAADHYSRIHAGGEQFFYDKSLTELESQLDPKQFVRIHKSTIVNLAAVHRVNVGRFGALVLVLRNGLDARVSRGRRSLFELAMLRWSDKQTGD